MNREMMNCSCLGMNVEVLAINGFEMEQEMVGRFNDFAVGDPVGKALELK